jgi:hypothetical protein
MPLPTDSVPEEKVTRQNGPCDSRHNAKARRLPSTGRRRISQERNAAQGARIPLPYIRGCTGIKRLAYLLSQGWERKCDGRQPRFGAVNTGWRTYPRVAHLLSIL